MAVVETGLLKYWNAKDGVKTGNVLANLAPSQAAHNMTITGATYNAAGYLAFDGVDDYTSVPNATAYQVGGAWTFEYIFYQSNNFGSGYHALVEGGAYFDQDHAYPGMYIEVYSGANSLPLEYVTSTISTIGLKHYVWRCTGTTLELWINNVLIASRAITGSRHIVSTANSTFHFNNGITTTEYQGRFHAHRFYNRSLTTAELTQNYNNGLEIGIAAPEPEPEPEPSGTTVHKGGLAVYYNPKNEASGATSLSNIAPNGSTAAMALVGSSVNASKVLTLAAGKSSHGLIADHPSYESIGSWSIEYVFTVPAAFPVATTKLLESENATTTVDEALVQVVRDATNTQLNFILFDQAGTALTINAPATALASSGRKHITIMHNAMTGNLFVYVNNVQVYTQSIVPVSFRTVGAAGTIFVNESSSSVALNFEAFRSYTDILSTTERQQNFDNADAIGLVDSEPPAEPTAGMPPDTAIPVKAETATFANGVGDIADSPNIWYNAASPADSVIFGTNKAANGGLGVYDLTGAQLQFLAVGACNNVDVRDGVFGNRVIVVTTNRTNNSLTFAWFDRTTRQLTLAESVAVGFEPYGCCLYVSPVNGDVYAFVTENAAFNGQLDQYRITASGNVVSGTKVRDMTTSSLAEGCAAHDSQSYLFLAVEEEGFYRYDAEPGAGNTPFQIDTVSRSGGPVADLEGVTIAYENSTSGYIIISSQGNSSFHIYDLAPPHAWRKSFTLVANGGIDAVSDTDGIAVVWKPMGPLYPNGIMVAHDSTNSGSDKSNFKYAELTNIIGTAPAVATPKVKIATLKTQSGELIPVYALSGHESIESFRLYVDGQKAFIPMVPTTDPAASKIRLRKGGVTLAMKL